MAKYTIPAIALVLGVAIGQNATASALVNLGRDRAIEDCSACHQVTASQKVPAPIADPDNEEWVPAPSFSQLAEKYMGHERELRAFILTPDHPMKEQEFLDTDLDAIIAYINSLAKSHRGRETRR